MNAPRLILLTASLLLAPLLASTVRANEAARVHARQGWIRLLPGNLPAGGYLTLSNDGDQPATIRHASSPVYAQIMLHHSSSETGMSRMSMVDALVVPAHGEATLSPGGYHLMLMSATRPVKVGDTVGVALHFADGSTLDTTLQARPANALAPAADDRRH